MTDLSAALAAIKRAREIGEVDWRHFPSYPGASNDFCAVKDATFIALDWIAEALPILKSLRDVTESVPRLGDDGKIDRVYKESLTYLTALIAQAEGQKEGENERI